MMNVRRCALPMRPVMMVFDRWTRGTVPGMVNTLILGCSCTDRRHRACRTSAAGGIAPGADAARFDIG